MTITEYLDAELDKAAAVLDSVDFTLGRKVDEMHSIVAALVVCVRRLDRELSRVQGGGSE